MNYLFDNSINLERFDENKYKIQDNIVNKYKLFSYVYRV